jgi:hypothetical protein
MMNVRVDELAEALLLEDVVLRRRTRWRPAMPAALHEAHSVERTPHEVERDVRAREELLEAWIAE